MGDESAVPTELAGIAEAQTRSVHAWALDDDEDELEYPSRRLTPRRITTAAVVVSLALAVIAGTLAYHRFHGTTASPSMVVAAPPAPPPLASAPMLDGFYRITHDYAATTYRNNEGKGGRIVHWHFDNNPVVTWYTFASACTRTDCIATGTSVDAQGVPKPDNPPLVMRYADGAWQDISSYREQVVCTDGSDVTGRAWESQTVRFEPRPDGTFGGTLTFTTETNECDDVGDTAVAPITLAHV